MINFLGRREVRRQPHLSGDVSVYVLSQELPVFGTTRESQKQFGPDNNASGAHVATLAGRKPKLRRQPPR